MESGRITDHFSSLTENIKDYINLRVDLAKLIITEKLSKVVSFFMIMVIYFIMAMFLLLFLSMTFVFWFGQYIGPFWLGTLIITAVYVLAGFLLYIRRHDIFINPLVGHLTKILMEDKDEND